MNALFQIGNNDGVIELIPIITFPVVATFVIQTVIQVLVTGLTLLYYYINQEILLNIVVGLIAAEIVCIIHVGLEHAFYKVDRLITHLKEEIKEKDQIIKNLLYNEDDTKDN
jgi:cell division protein FtsW (lipid II flippase)